MSKGSADKKTLKKLVLAAGGDIEVENTNLESHRSKQSLAQYGYREDLFLCKFGQPVVAPRSAAVNQGYLARAIAIENTFEKAVIRWTLKKESFQILSCGAGFDTTYFRLKNAGVLSEKCRYFEVDFPNVALEKAKKVVHHRLLMNLVLDDDDDRNRFFLTDEQGHFQAKNYTVMGCDLTKTDDLHSLLQKFKFQFDVPTLVLCECSLTYIEANKASRLFRWLSSNLSKAHLFVYEQINPQDRFGKIMINHFTDRSTPLLNVDSYPSLEDQEMRLRCLGFSRVSSVSLSDIVMANYNDSERERRFFLEKQYDEFEELFLKCSHYSILEGITGESHDAVWNGNRMPIKELPLLEIQECCFSTRSCHSLFRRYGHQIKIIGNNQLVLMGGNSILTGRDNVLALFDLANLNQPEYTGYLEFKCNTYCGSSSVENGTFYVFGGRSSPGESSNKLFKIKIVQDKATQLEELEIEVNSSVVPEERWKHSLDRLGSSLVLVGGKNLAIAFSDIFGFNLDSRKWKKLGNLPVEIFSHSSCISKESDFIIISGGLDKNERISNKIWKISLEKESLTVIPIQKTHFSPRFGHTSYLHGSKLFLFGGVSNHSEPGLAVIDLLKPELSREYYMQIPRSIGNYNHAGVLYDDKIIITGGGGNCFSFGMHIGTEALEINLKYI